MTNSPLSESSLSDAQALAAETAATDLEDTRKVVASLPKVLLHDHLDGGLRPQTVIELAADCGYTDQLPTTDVDELEQWFIDTGNSGSLPSYLTAFAHTCAVMQTAESLTRVAREAVEDLADDNVVYAELRLAPENHLEKGLDMQAVVDALVEGLAQGEAHAAAAGRDITARLLICAMRQNDNSKDVAQLVIDNYGERSGGYVVGFDIAGPENDFPPANHAEAFTMLRENLIPVTIHAGEDAGVESLRDAVVQGAMRLGHGVRVYEDFGASLDGIECQSVAAAIRDRQLPLEICPTSNVQTGVCDSVADHPFPLLDDMRFACTVNTDNRLIGATSMTRECMELVENFGYGYSELFELTCNALNNAFADLPTRERIMDNIIYPAYLQLIDGDDEDGLAGAGVADQFGVAGAAGDFGSDSVNLTLD